MITDRQTANVQARQMLASFGLQGEGVYRGYGFSLESQLADHIADGTPFLAFTDDRRRIEFDGKGHIVVSPADPHAFH